jgi:hypothetical protein
VLWDAYRQPDFSYSKNVQVKATPLLEAVHLGIGQTVRKLTTGDELVIAARADHLREALAKRVLAQ